MSHTFKFFFFTVSIDADRLNAMIENKSFQLTLCNTGGCALIIPLSRAVIKALAEKKAANSFNLESLQDQKAQHNAAAERNAAAEDAAFFSRNTTQSEELEEANRNLVDKIRMEEQRCGLCAAEICFCSPGFIPCHSTPI